MKTKFYIICLLTTLLATGCSKSKSAPGAGGADALGTPGKVVAHVKYVKGDAAATDIDLEIDFTDPNEFLIDVNTGDPQCSRSGELSRADASDMFDLVSKLQLLRSSGPSPAGTEIEYIQITSTDGSVAKYHLASVEVPDGEYFAINPQALSTFLEELFDNLPPEVCAAN